MNNNKAFLELKTEVEKLDFVGEVLLVSNRGSRNHGLYQEGESDKDYLVLYAPTSKNLLLSSGTKQNKTLNLENNTEVLLTNVQNLEHLFFSANLLNLDFLWSKATYTNPKYHSFFKWLNENAFLLLKERQNKSLLSGAYSYKNLRNNELTRGVKPSNKNLVNTVYHFFLSSLLLETKTKKRFYTFANSADQWDTMFDLPNLKTMKFNASDKGKRALYKRMDNLLNKFQEDDTRLSNSLRVEDETMFNELQKQLCNLMRSFLEQNWNKNWVSESILIYQNSIPKTNH